MALDSAYFTPEEYRARTTKSDAGDDDTILAQGKAVARYLEQRLGRHFNQDAAPVTHLWRGSGRAHFWLPSEIATTTGLVVKVDLDGDFDFDAADETLTLNTHFWVEPADALTGPEPKPYQYLAIVPNNGRLYHWPYWSHAVQVTATFGWPAVPGAIREATISVTRQLRDMQESGFTLTLQSIDSVVNASPQMSALLLDMERQYARTSRWFV